MDWLRTALYRLRHRERPLSTEELQIEAAMYCFIEAEIRSVWARGARSHLQGNVKDAVLHWSEAMARQRRLSRRLHPGDDVRFFGPVWTCAIGHIALLATYAQARALGLMDAKRFVVDATSTVANRAYLDYFAPHFEILDDPASARELEGKFRAEHPGALGIGRKWMFLNSAIGFVQERWMAEKRPPLLSLKSEHRARGEETLRAWGVPDGAWFVALHVREGGRISGGMETDCVRNVQPMDYLPAIRAITDAGGWVIRIGGSDYTPLPAMPNVVDYATTQPHQDWLDVFLLGAARFMVATNSGPAWVANSFGRPILFTNWAPTGVDPFWPGASVLRKTLYALVDGRDLAPEMQRAEPTSQLESLERLRQGGYGIRGNNADELAAATEEFLRLH
jgi:putative glycosyltransferase (TIGR04372 family)